MQATIITLLVIGIFVFVITFLIKPQNNTKEDSKQEYEKLMFTKEEKQSLIENASIEIVEITQDKIEDAKDELEKISNEKLMAVGEFSDNVLSEMDKTHKEIMFLYNMLNEKESEIKKLIEEKTNQAKLSREEMDLLKQKQAEEQDVKKDIESKEILKSNDKNSEDLNDLKNPISTTITDSPSTKTFSEKEEDDESERKRDNSNRQIIELYEDGLSIVDIAKKLNLGKGEVKLVVDLFSQKNE